MNNVESKTLLAAKLAEYHRLPYSALAARVGNEEHLDITGPSGTKYQVEIQVLWDCKPAGPIRVLGSIDDGGLRAFVPLCDSLIVPPD